MTIIVIVENREIKSIKRLSFKIGSHIFFWEYELPG